MGQQTTANVAQTGQFAGMLADLDNAEIRTYVNEEASAEIPFGVMVGQGTLDSDALLLAAQADIQIGVLVHDHAYDKPNELGDTGLKPNVTMGILTKGTIWVEVEEAVTPASSVRVRAVVTGNEVAGAFRDTADASDTIDISKFARYLDTAAINGLTRLYIDMTGRNDRTND